MNRTIVAVLLILASVSSFADEGQRYLVATRRPLLAGELRTMIREARGIEPFDTFRGFAAELTESEVAELRRSPNVRWVEPVIERHAFAVPRNTGGQTVPYGVDLVHAREAWAGVRKDLVNVAVLDTGVDYRHEELSAVWAGGQNFINAELPPIDDAGHGTHVAGTIAAANNTAGVVGVSPQVRLWGVKVLNANGSGTNETIIKGVDWVVAKKKELGGNWVINLSLGSKKPSAAEEESMRRAADAGILIVAASGNESNPTLPAPVAYPAAYPTVVAVGAINQEEKVASFSNQGPELDLVAPGVEILSTMPVGSTFISSITAGAGNFNADALTGSGVGSVTGEYVSCGVGHPSQIPAEVDGRIAIIKRGELTFAEKARNAFERGARAVVIFNHDDSALNWTLRASDYPWSFDYPFGIVVALTNLDGEALLRHNGPITVSNEADDYGVNNGTSMATPHVAAAAALLWAMAPRATAAEVVNALVTTAVDRGAPGPDPAYGAGVIHILAAAKQLAPGAFSAGPTTGRPIGLRRGRG